MNNIQILKGWLLESDDEDGVTAASVAVGDEKVSREDALLVGAALKCCAEVASMKAGDERGADICRRLLEYKGFQRTASAQGLGTLIATAVACHVANGKHRYFTKLTSMPQIAWKDRTSKWPGDMLVDPAMFTQISRVVRTPEWAENIGTALTTIMRVARLGTVEGKGLGVPGWLMKNIGVLGTDAGWEMAGIVGGVIADRNAAREGTKIKPGRLEIELLETVLVAINNLPPPATISIKYVATLVQAINSTIDIGHIVAKNISESILRITETAQAWVNTGDAVAVADMGMAIQDLQVRLEKWAQVFERQGSLGETRHAVDKLRAGWQAAWLGWLHDARGQEPSPRHRVRG